MNFLHLSMISLLFGPALCGFAKADPVGPDIYTLEDYLTQVALHHDGFLAAEQTIKSAQLKPNEALQIFSPNLFANLSHREDGSSPYQMIGATSMITNDAAVGIKKNFSSGTSATLSYDLSSTDIIGANPVMLRQSSYYSEKPSLEIRQPLWRNAGGREFNATAEMARTQSDSTIYNEYYKTTMVLMNAELAYWKLSLAREAWRIQRENLVRAQELYRWTKSRVASGLADKSDELQAKAMADLRSLDVMKAQNDEREAAEDFNSMRGLEAQNVTEQLTPFSTAVVDKISIPKRATLRDDTKAEAALAKSLAISAALSAEKNQPSLDAFASLMLNGQNAGASDIFNNSFATKGPTWTVGLSLNMPLDRDLINAINQETKLAAQAAEQNLRRNIFVQELKWRNLASKLDEALSRLKLAGDIAKIQQIKLDVEKDRHKHGRTTLSQVILFEQDYAGAKLGELSRIAEVLSIYAEMKTFTGHTRI